RSDEEGFIPQCIYFESIIPIGTLVGVTRPAISHDYDARRIPLHDDYRSARKTKLVIAAKNRSPEFRSPIQDAQFYLISKDGRGSGRRIRVVALIPVTQPFSKPYDHRVTRRSKPLCSSDIMGHRCLLPPNLSADRAAGLCGPFCFTACAAE